MNVFCRSLATLSLCFPLCLPAQSGAPPAGLDWVPLGRFDIARTETTVAQFAAFVKATGWVTQAERDGGGHIYEAGWVRKPGWTWRQPFGQTHHPQSPAVQVNFRDAQAFCQWAGGRLPTDAEWVSAAYTEQRSTPGYVRGKTYPYPTGDSPVGAQCLGDCGPDQSVPTGAHLWRGQGPALAGSTRMGVNGLYDMGANVWEWVDEPAGASDEKRTRGGSWWYGAGPMKADHLASKSRDFAVVYIGFRCARGG